MQVRGGIGVWGGVLSTPYALVERDMMHLALGGTALPYGGVWGCPYGVDETPLTKLRQSPFDLRFYPSAFVNTAQNIRQLSVNVDECVRFVPPTDRLAEPNVIRGVDETVDENLTGCAVVR